MWAQEQWVYGKGMSVESELLSSPTEIILQSILEMNMN
jgi:hypothetical protein